MKNIEYFLQAVFAYIFFSILKIMPVGWSSALGGFVGRNILVYTSWTKTAKKNLLKVYPEMSEKDVKKTIKGIFNNIGRVAGEYPHLEKMTRDCGIDNPDKRINITGYKNIEQILKDDKAVLFVGAHISNWEIVRGFHSLFPKDLGCVYRAPNNPFIDKLLSKLRGNDKYTLYQKTPDGMKKMTKDIKNGVYIGLLVDQWLSSGTETEFLGIKTKSPSLYTKFAKKYGAHIVPCEFKRLDGKCKFETVFHPEIKVSEKDKDEDIVQKVNDKLSEFIKDNPENWLWIHNRFK